jgi:phage baseplate assembly protein gpV
LTVAVGPFGPVWLSWLQRRPQQNRFSVMSAGREEGVMLVMDMDVGENCGFLTCVQARVALLPMMTPRSKSTACVSCGWWRTHCVLKAANKIHTGVQDSFDFDS